MKIKKSLLQEKDSSLCAKLSINGNILSWTSENHKKWGAKKRTKGGFLYRCYNMSFVNEHVNHISVYYSYSAMEC